MALTTCPPVSDLKRLHLGGLPPADAEALEQHVLECMACLAQLKASFPASDTLTDAMANQATMVPAESDIRVRDLIKRLEAIPVASSAARGSVMIAIVCPSCTKKLSVKEELAGKKVKCPGCAAIVPVPAKAKVAVDARPKENMATIPPSVAGDGATIPPMGSPSAEMQATPPPASQADPTEGLQPEDSGHDTSLTDFLTPPQAADELGRLGTYRILKILGHGGMGVVYKAEDPKLKRAVAIKAMLPTLAASASAGKRFLREAEAMAKLEHDHVVRVYQVTEDRGIPFLAMEFLKGEPLDVRLNRGERLSVPEIMRVGREIAEALSAAHEHNLIHRDIKPGNIWIEAPKGRVKILDFGLARATSQDSGLTQQGAIVGTPAYMAPEQARGDTVDARCDLWALGVVLYRICTGVQPFVGKDTVSTLMAVAMQDPKSPHELNAEIPEELSNLVMHLLEKDPERRLDKAEEVVARLRRMEKDWARTHDEDSRTSIMPAAAKTAISAAPRTQHAAQPSTIAQSPRRNRGVLIGAALAVLALVAGGVVYFMQTPHGTVRVEINDPKIKVTINGEQLAFEGADNKTITVKAGQNGLTVQRDDFSFDTTKFELKKGETVTLKIDWFAEGKVQVARDGKVIGEKRDDVQIATPGNYVLEFDGDASVELPVMKAKVANRLSEPFTLEAWAKPTELQAKKSKDLSGHYVFQADRLGAGLFIQLSSKKWVGRTTMLPVSLSENPAKLGRPVRVALTFDGEFQRLFVDGKLVAADAVNRSPFFDGPIGVGNGFIGQIDDIRISKICRYTADYTPGRPENDKDTLALYHCDEGAGDVLKDSSGNGHHGKIVGAKWVKADGAPDSIAPDFALEFDTRSKVELLSLKLDTSRPFTVEGFVTQSKLALGSQRAIVSDSIYLQCQTGTVDPGKIRWHFHADGSLNAFQSIAASGIELNQKMHTAGVFDGKELRFYINGRVVGRKSLDAPIEPTNRNWKFGREFTGILDEVRFSKVARYDKDFTPALRHEPDADTLALYHFDEGEGDILKDSSGNGHDGKIVGAKWVKVDGAGQVVAPEPSRYALKFEHLSNNDFNSVAVGGISKHFSNPPDAFTVETYVTPAENNWTTKGVVFLGDARLHIQNGKWNQYFGVLREGSKDVHTSLSGKAPVVFGRRYHVAVVKSGQSAALFVDGRLCDRTTLTGNESGPNFTNISLGEALRGTMDQFSISKTARYHQDFKPPVDFPIDKNTVVLYRFNEGQGDILKDSSGNGHDGKIVGAKWVKVDGTVSPPPPGNYALNFDGDGVVELNGLKGIPGKEFTFEAYFTIDKFTDKHQSAIMCERRAMLQVLPVKGGGPKQAEWEFGSMFTRTLAPAVLNRRVHVAAVLNGTNNLLFIDGKLAAKDTINPAKLDWLNQSWHLGKGFFGTFDEVRVSTTARYDKDFTPQLRFEPDAATFFLYHCDEGQGDVLTDSSGNGYHGKIVGAKWVKGDGIPLKLQRYALEFTDDDPSLPQFFDAPALIDRTKPFTVEGYFTVTSPKSRSTLGLFNLSGRPRLTYAGGWTWGYEDMVDGKKTFTQISSTAAPALHRRIHLAGVRSADKLVLFVDGKMLGSADVPPGTLTGKARAVFGNMLIGTMDQVRISSVARYDKDFTPPAQLTAEPGTEGLYLFEEGKGDTVADASGQNRHGKIIGAKWVKADSGKTAPESKALAFDGKTAYVELPALPFHTQPFTLEGYVKSEGGDERMYLLNNVVGADGGGVSFHLADQALHGVLRVIPKNQGDRAQIAATSNAVPGFSKEWRHVALTYDGGKLAMFLNGAPAGATPNVIPTPPAPGNGNLRLGGSSYAKGLFAGQMREFRISKGARYSKRFVPEPRFEPDADTLALYHMDEGQGDVLTDSSGNGHHGKIVAAKWVKADAAPIVPTPSQSQYALEFDGETAYVEATSLEPPTPLPLTVEAYITPKANKGSRPPIRFGAPKKGLVTIQQQNGRWFGYSGFNPTRDIVESPVPLRPGEPSHVALVWDGKGLPILFVDGKRSVEHEPKTIQRAGMRPGLFLGGYFYKEKDPDGQVGFAGRIHEVRVSKTIRYDKDFTPAKRFQPDADTLALYHFDEGQGDVLTDSSGNGHHGKIIGAKWVKIGDATPRPPENAGPNPPVGSPFDALKRENIPLDALIVAGGGDADKADKELVAVFGVSRKVTNRSLAISPDGSRIFVGFAPEDAMQAWDVATGQMLPEWNKECYTSGGLSLSHDGRRLVRVAAKTLTYIVADALTGKDLFTLGEQTKFGTFDATRGIALSPDGTQLATCNGMGQVRIWDVATGQKRSDLELPSCSTMSLTYSPNGKWLVAHSLDRDKSNDENHVTVWNANDGKQVLRKRAGSAYLSKNLAVSADSSWLVVNGPTDSKTMELWDLPSGETKATAPLQGRPQAVSPDGKYFLALGGTGMLLFDTATGVKVQEWKTYVAPYRAAFAPDGRHVVLGNNDGTIHILRLMQPAGK